MRPLMVLAGGFGTRLRAVVSDVPKPLAPVSNLPFIMYLIDNWVRQGVDDFIFLLHYEAWKIEAVLKEISRRRDFSNVNFRVEVERTPLGTGGAVLNAARKFGVRTEFFVTNADTWLSAGINELASFDSPALAAVLVSNTGRYGALKFEGDTISVFEEKLGLSDSGYVNSGLYCLSFDIFDGCEPGTQFSLERKIFPMLVAEKRLKAVKLDCSFIDIGIPEDYLQFCKWVDKNEF